MFLSRFGRKKKDSGHAGGCRCGSLVPIEPQPKATTTTNAKA